MDLRTALAERGLSIRAAARRMNYDPAYLSRVLNGRQAPSAALLKALEDLLGGPWEPLPSPRGHRADPCVVAAQAKVLAAQRRAEDLLGSAAVVPQAAIQTKQATALARSCGGPHQPALLAVAAEWHQFLGWLYVATRQGDRALALLTTAEQMADEAEDAVVAATAVSFRGYAALLRGNPRGAVRASFAALHTPGAHPAQRVYDHLQVATAYTRLGERDEARRMLDRGIRIMDSAGDPPPLTYWYTPAFFHMHVGLVRSALGDHDEARDLLRNGLDALPAEQRGAEWTQVFRDALERC